MANIYVDTDKIKLSGENIKKYASQYNQIVEDLFLAIKNLEMNGAWVGDGENSSVRKYIDLAMKEKEKYSDLAIAINNFGEAIITYAADINTVASDDI